MDNWLKVIDIENLFFDEDVILEISKIAGTRLLRGRLKKTPMEKGGQTIITRLIAPPVVNIVESYASPKKGFEGDKFVIEATLHCDREKARFPVHKLDVSKSGSGQLEATVQDAIEYRLKVGTPEESRCELLFHASSAPGINGEAQQPRRRICRDRGAAFPRN